MYGLRSGVFDRSARSAWIGQHGAVIGNDSNSYFVSGALDSENSRHCVPRFRSQVYVESPGS